jgi:hypothetical protein
MPTLSPVVRVTGGAAEGCEYFVSLVKNVGQACGVGAIITTFAR